MSKTPILDKINYPSDLRKLEEIDLEPLADELRTELIEIVSKTGGHLGAGLGVVELTIALHYIFDTPDDKLVWDVGHHTYPHKILTGRRKLMEKLRQGNGLSGFTSRSESEYDVFGAAHSSTSISSSLGISVARNLSLSEGNVIAVIGDGAMSAGMAYEAMNNAGSMNNRLIVILNDNDMSIAPPVGAMSAYLAKLISGGAYTGIRRYVKKLISHLPKRIRQSISKAEEYSRGFFTGGTLFEELGFYYVGPIDGHNFKHLLPILKNVKNSKEGPILLHIVTQKGKGYEPAERSADKFHGVSKFDISTGTQIKPNTNIKSYTNTFSTELTKIAKEDNKIIAITAAMPNGTGLDKFANLYPERYFDVGIAEQHAVTFAAGLATEGYKPFCSIYSTFLQRAYDQVVHDVAIQKLPVRFAIDRAGLVGADGATHAGSFDITYLASLPNFIVMAPSNELELARMVVTAADYNEGPIAFRYPRGNGIGIEFPNEIKPIRIGKGKIIKQGEDIVLLCYGTLIKECLEADIELKKLGFNITLVDARFVKPLDEELILKLIENHYILITIEEGSIGGFASHVNNFLIQGNHLDSKLKIKNIFLPDFFLQQDTQENQYIKAGLNSDSIVDCITSMTKIDR